MDETEFKRIFLACLANEAMKSPKEFRWLRESALLGAMTNLGKRQPFPAWWLLDRRAKFIGEDSEEAKELRDRAARLKPAGARLHLDLAFLALCAEDEKKGIAEIKNAVALDPRGEKVRPALKQFIAQKLITAHALERRLARIIHEQ